MFLFAICFLTTDFVSFLNIINVPLRYTEIFSTVKLKIFRGKNKNFNIFAQNIDCGYTLEPPRRDKK